VPAGVLPQPWAVASANPAGVTLQPPSPLRAAGAQNVDRPALAASAAQPAAVVDAHGALALAWIEGRDTATGFDLVLRRAWVDWSGQSSRAAAFDAPVVVARGVPPDTIVKIARVAGGVVVAWAAPDAHGRPSVTMRRVGLDMTCTREQAAAGPMSRAGSQRD
jgi:hypothetical protein